MAGLSGIWMFVGGKTISRHNSVVILFFFLRGIYHTFLAVLEQKKEYPLNDSKCFVTMSYYNFHGTEIG